MTNPQTTAQATPSEAAMKAAKALYPYGTSHYCWGDEAKNEAARERDWQSIARKIDAPFQAALSYAQSREAELAKALEWIFKHSVDGSSVQLKAAAALQSHASQNNPKETKA